MKNNKKFLSIVLFTAAILLFQGCLNEERIKSPFVSMTPAKLNDGWETASPSDAGIDSSALTEVFREFHDNQDIWQVRSLTVIRNGKLIAESYTKDESDRITPRAIWSCTKQFMGILTGIAIERGLIASIDDPVSKYLPMINEKYPDKKSITIRNLLMMQSGIDYNNYGLSGDDSKILQQIPENYLDFVLGKKLISKPGTEFDYKDSDPQILASVIESVTGKPLDVWADEVLFSKIGFINWQWRRYRDGSALGSFGIMTTPRELGKAAQLVLNGGEFAGERILSSAWISAMTSPLVKTDDKHFGYLWWSYPEYNTYFMAGNGRQLVFFFQEKNLIVIITSETNPQGKFNLSTITGRNYAVRIAELCR